MYNNQKASNLIASGVVSIIEVDDQVSGCD